MKKRIIPILVIFILSLFAGLFSITVDIIPALAASPDASADGKPFTYGYTSQRASFNAHDRTWLFYTDGTDLLFTSSADLSSWDAPTTVKAGINKGQEFSIYFDGTYVHVVYGDCQALNTDLYYRRGDPAVGGTISWSAAEQTAVAADVSYCNKYPSITTGTSGYPYISYAKSTSTSLTGFGYAHVTKSSTNDGTWVTDDGFPYEIDGVNDTRPTLVLRTRTAENDIYCIYQGASDDLYGKKYDYDLDTWGSAELVESDAYTNITGLSGATSSSYIHISYTDTDGDLCYKERHYSTGWGTSELIEDNGLYLVPSLTVLRNAEIAVTYIIDESEEDYPLVGAYSLITVDGEWQLPLSVSSDDAYYTDLTSQASSDETPFVVFYVDSDKDIQYGYSQDLTCTADTASPIYIQTATVRGSITVPDSSMTDEVQYMFEYGETVPYDYDTSWQYSGSLASGSYSYELEDLEPNTTYHYRIAARNSFDDGYSWYSDDATFTTGEEALEPDDFICTYKDSDSIDLSWVLGDYASGLIIRYSTTEFPATAAQGSSAYSATGGISTIGHTTLSNLTAGTTYYFSAWGTDFGDIYYISEDYVTLAVTTTVGFEEEEFIPPVDDPTAVPDTTDYEDKDWYDVMEVLSDLYQFDDVGYFIRFIAMFAIAFLSILLVLKTGSIFVPLITVVALYGIGYHMGFIPFYIIVFYIVIAGLISYTKSTNNA